MTPNHAIFRKIFEVCLSVHKRTFDYLPDADTKYPFIYVGENQNLETENHELYGILHQTIHIYHSRTERAELDNMTSQLLRELRKLDIAYNYAISYKRNEQRDIPDNTDVKPLIHRALDISFNYSEIKEN